MTQERSDVTTTAHQLLCKASNLSNDPPADQPVNQTVDSCILLTSELVACSKLLAAVDPSSNRLQKQLLEAAKSVVLLADDLLEVCGCCCGDCSCRMVFVAVGDMVVVG